MLQNCGDTQKPFAKSVPVTLKDGLANQCRKCTLFLTVEWKEFPAAVNKKELLISLTDSNDPFFLYHLHLSEEDFQVLKSSQGLLVDFTAFPQKFIDLIEICVAEENNASPKFLLIFNTSERSGSISSTSQLDVVETNPFKHLIHLTLKFIAATDSSVKQYLAVTLKKLKEEKQHLESQLSYLEQDSRSRLSSNHASLEQKTQELEKLKNDLSVQLTLRETKHASQLQEERNKLLNKQRELETRFENEKKEKEYNYYKDLQQLEKRVSCLDTLNKELNDRNHKSESTIQALEDETRHSKEAVQEYKEKIQKLQSELKQKLSEISLQKVRIEELDSTSVYLKTMLTKLQEQFENSVRNEKAIKSQYDDLQKEYRECKKVVKSQETDIYKGHEVILKLQRQIQLSHEDVKDIQSRIEEQQRMISYKDKIIRTLRKELNDSKQDLEEKSYETKRMSDSYTSLQESNTMLKKEIKSRDDVIKFLNRQLVDKSIFPQHVPPTNQEHNSPFIDKRHSAGDAEIIDLVQNASIAATENPKTFSGRNGNSPGLQNNVDSSPNYLPRDSANSSSPSGNAKNTSKSLNRDSNTQHTGNFELDSAALSAAFGNSDVLKHSTAKKLVNSRTGKVLRGRR